jgi:limonene-1,2-epoxide hydrolase
VASKHGVVGLVRSVAISVQAGVRVNALCPGMVDTALLRRLIDISYLREGLLALKPMGQPVNSTRDRGGPCGASSRVSSPVTHSPSMAATPPNNVFHRNKPKMNAADSKQLVLDFLASWHGRDIDHIMSFFADEALYHNVPVQPIRGLAPIRQIFESFLREFRAASLDVVAAVAEPGLVIAERIDRFQTNSGREVELPVTGVFVVDDRKIVRFSDYFDLDSFQRQSGLTL